MKAPIKQRRSTLYQVRPILQSLKLRMLERAMWECLKFAVSRLI